MKNDYEITINTSNMSKEQKKNIQDAFFKLGIPWYDLKIGEYFALDMESKNYSNTTSGVVNNYILRECRNKQTHTYEQLMKLAFGDEYYIKRNEELNSDKLREIFISNSEKIKKLQQENKDITDKLLSRGFFIVYKDNDLHSISDGV